ncbi:MAG: hypothetical protein AABZ47_01480 [Planctomycetota bacterium]
MKKKNSFRLSGRSSLLRLLSVSLVGSLVAVSCNTRFRGAVVDGATNYLYSTLFDPETIVDIVVQSTAGEP